MMREVEPDAAAIHERDEDKCRPSCAAAEPSWQSAVRPEGTERSAGCKLHPAVELWTIAGYKLNGKNVPWFTTMGGAYEHAAQHGNKPPYQLPESWINYKPAIDLKTPYDTVSTPDIIGGNSGSPVINKAAEVVGIIFDGNIESLAWNFAYSDKVARAVEVDSRAIIESLKQDLPRRWTGE